ncbi:MULTISPECIES: HNH endonuclease signature motif containing protein [Enterococcus]|uniref:HNH endonuclease signature motif containing protein n=1 Tax=Enterococcus TaxID=1350 RepID=UPI001564F6EE|nr:MULTISPECIES: HNH endonuclease signature motif containing protein [Enterococcus]MCD5030340.1 HNH endonuclease [Enterococcus asini]
MKPRKLCNKAGCRVLVDYNQSYCEKHKRTKVSNVSYSSRKADGGKYFAFYKSRAWEKMSYIYRLNNPCCEQCLKAGVIHKADVVDHIVEIRDDYSRRLDEKNLQSLCHACHNKKTAIEKKKRKKPSL